ncbi:hypothetical protein [Streptomyces goshikiensis]
MLILNRRARHRDPFPATPSMARDSDQQARRDEAVLDALEPLAGLRR